MKRFYKLVSTKKQPEGYEILLDGKPIKTPSDNSLVVATEELANEIVGEWAGQGEEISPDSMPLTQILSTQIDQVSMEREAMTETLMKYLDTDLLCYRTAQPPELVTLQAEAWDPFLTWFEERFGEALQTTTTLQALTQNSEIHQNILGHIKSMGDDAFTVLQLVTSLSGSLVLGLAFVEGAVTPEQVFAAAHVEEHHKAEIYDEKTHGPDPMQAQKQAAMKKDLAAAKKFLAFSGNNM